jgi:hypothetical protein
MNRIGRKANLIIHNHVNRTTDTKIIHLRQLHRLVHNALSSKGSITVKKNRNHIANIFGTKVYTERGSNT